jgi:sodium transport system ATP-binding protein
MIQVTELRKIFGHVMAVDGMTFSAQRGEIFGLLGPNGAGKTTSLRMIYGLLRPTSGSLTVAGMDVNEQPLNVRKRMGVLPDGGGLYTRLTARENIAYFGALHGMSKIAIDRSIDDFVNLLNMQDIIDRKTGGFSQGERMKVSLVRALVHDPDYILLDEPTNGLDVATTRAVRRLLLRMKDAGKCILFSSHLMHEVAQLCDRVAIVVRGKVAAQGSIESVQRQAGVNTMEDAFIHFAYGKEQASDV